MHESSANAQNLQLQHATMEEMSEPAEGGSDAHLQPERSRKVRSAGARRGFLAASGCRRGQGGGTVGLPLCAVGGSGDTFHPRWPESETKFPAC